MEFVNPVNEVEQLLKEAGEQLALPLPSSSIKDLLDLLDRTEQLLSFVGQAPSISMQGALVPSMGSLIGDELLKHSDLDVRVSVASCLCEVARITAPEPPYKDEIMKEIFQLNVIAFRQLSNMTGQRYYKAVHILESVAKVKSCLLMLDLECDDLVLEMFEQLFSNIRANHPHSVFSAMETIMTLIIQESDEIANELLSLLISHVRKEKQSVLPAPWKLAEKVLRNCNDTLKSYSGTIMKLLKSNPDNYAEVVTSLCQSAYENGHATTKSTKRDLNTLENGGSIKSLNHSQAKKQKYIDAERVAAVSKKIDRNRLQGKEQETSQNFGSANGSHSARGVPKKKKTTINLVQDSEEDLKKTRSQDKPKGMKTSTGKSAKQVTETKGVSKGNNKTSGSLYNAIIKKEKEPLSDYGVPEPLLQQMNDNVQIGRQPSSKKRVANGSRGKDNPKKFGQDLVGHRIKVWWPLDKMYYEGAVSSYNTVDKKHKVLYADGDEELLDLNHEKWRILDETLHDQQQEQVADIPSPVTIPAKRPKPKEKRKLDSSITQKDNSNLPKRPRPTPGYSLRTKPTKEQENKGANSSTTDILCKIDNPKDDSVQTPVISCGLKSTEKAIEVEQDGESNPSTKFEGRLPASSETTEVEHDGEPNPSLGLEEKRLPDLSQPVVVEQAGVPNPSVGSDEKRLPDFSETVEVEQDGESNPSRGLEENRLPVSSQTIDVEQDGHLNPSGELEAKRLPESSQTIDVEQDCEPNPSGELEEKRLPESSVAMEVDQDGEHDPSGKLEEKSQMIDVEQDGEPNPSGELEEKRLPESSVTMEVDQDGEHNSSEKLEEKRLPEARETMQRLEQPDELVCEPDRDHITA